MQIFSAVRTALDRLPDRPVLGGLRSAVRELSAYVRPPGRSGLGAIHERFLAQSVPSPTQQSVGDRGMSHPGWQGCLNWECRDSMCLDFDEKDKLWS
jgi:hypothetical protein